MAAVRGSFRISILQAALPACGGWRTGVGSVRTARRRRAGFPFRVLYGCRPPDAEQLRRFAPGMLWAQKTHRFVGGGHRFVRSSYAPWASLLSGMRDVKAHLLWRSRPLLSHPWR